MATCSSYSVVRFSADRDPNSFDISVLMLIKDPYITTVPSTLTLSPQGETMRIGIGIVLSLLVMVCSDSALAWSSPKAYVSPGGSPHVS